MKFSMKKTVLGAVLASMLALPGVAFANFNVAVATGFAGCLNALILEYNGSGLPGSDITITPTHSSAGLLDIEIRDNPNLYQLFFSANVPVPKALVDDGLAAGPVVVYAKGKTVAYSTTYEDSDAIQGAIDAVVAGEDINIGICNPAMGPYGKVAETYFAGHDINVNTDARFTFYDNLELLKAAVDNDIEDIGIMSLSMLYDIDAEEIVGEYWQVPVNLLNQGACLVLQTPGVAINTDAQAFLNWVMTDIDADTIIRTYGYER